MLSYFVLFRMFSVKLGHLPNKVLTDKYCVAVICFHDKIVYNNMFGITKYSECCEIVVLKLDILNVTCVLKYFAHRKIAFVLTYQ